MLATPRLTLRPLRPTDAAWIAQEIARPEVHRWLPTVPRPYGPDDAAAFISAKAAQPGYRVIELGGTPTGVVSIDLESAAELGYWLQPAAWGQGIMTEAAAALLGWFDQSIGGDVHAGYLEGNTASAHVLGKLGFRLAGTAQRHSCFLGTEVTSNRMRRPATP